LARLGWVAGYLVPIAGKHINSWNLWMISGIYTEFMDVFDFFFIPPKNGIGIETWPYYVIYIYHYLYIQNDQNEHIA
jgi:hypothetical protein